VLLGVRTNYLGPRGGVDTVAPSLSGEPGTARPSGARQGRCAPLRGRLRRAL